MEPPKRVLGGRYELAGKLAEGGMGQVHRARDLLKNGTVAVKLLQNEVATDDVVRERFRREADVLRTLDHPSLVRLLDSELTGREPYLVFEYVEGERLDRVANGQPMPVLRAIEFALEIASAVSALHAHQIVHRDLKPTNIIVRPDGRICVLDFGTAKHFGDAESTLDQLTTEGFVVGTLQYMPPEALFTKAPLAPTYDVWAIGVILWELLAGRRPFADVEERGITAFMDSFRECHPPPISGVRTDLPAHVATLVRGLLERDRERRPPDGHAVVRELEMLRAELAGDLDPGTREMGQKTNRRDTPVSRRLLALRSGNTMVMPKEGDDAIEIGPRKDGPAPRSRAALALTAFGCAMVAIAVALLYLRGPGAPVAEAPWITDARAHAHALAPVIARWHADPAALIQALRAAADSPSSPGSCGALRKAMEAHGLRGELIGKLNPLASALVNVKGPVQAELAAPFFALELSDLFAQAEGLPAECLTFTGGLPPGLVQKPAPVIADAEPRRIRLAANGKGRPGSARFRVRDPGEIGAVWLSLSGTVKRGHVVRIRLNSRWLAMGGMDPGPGRELRRGIPPHFLVAGENLLEAQVLGVPAAAIGDADTLEVTLRLPSP